ncbi:hypothetical protein OEZ85_004627 [Tetradesmus obliquus]|uniref:Uncharacterized protein n=1 Tax=Tetradesmus obliquus TaxID=3088 RepID=A0ABY8UPK6_TETOB|nr:hypothetical protein OEZ85_004627 [Tetradesmus obliquus]
MCVLIRQPNNCARGLSSSLIKIPGGSVPAWRCCLWPSARATGRPGVVLKRLWAELVISSWPVTLTAVK